MALLPLLGVTWLLGFFVDFHDAVKYAFILVNSIMVRIMTTLVLLNETKTKTEN